MTSERDAPGQTAPGVAKALVAMVGGLLLAAGAITAVVIFFSGLAAAIALSLLAVLIGVAALTFTRLTRRL